MRKRKASLPPSGEPAAARVRVAAKETCRFEAECAVFKDPQCFFKHQFEKHRADTVSQLKA